MRETPYSTAECIKASNLSQFEIALISAKRTRELNRGASPYIKDTEGLHNKTIAMMEITAKKIGVEYLTK